MPTMPVGPIARLTTFTTHGKTFTFKMIFNLVADEFQITFDYRAMSDGRTKHHTAFVSNLAGYSVTE